MFSVQFFPDGRARYVSFAPNRGNPGLTDRLYAQTTSDQLIDQATKLDVHGWLCR